MKLEIKNLTKNLGNEFRLDNISFNLDNEILGVIGPSGSGKTTLLYLIQGLLKPDSGNIILDNIDITSLHSSNRHISLLLQDSPFINHLNVFNNIVFFINKKRDIEKNDTLNNYVFNQLNKLKAILSNNKIDNKKELIKKIYIEENIPIQITKKYFAIKDKFDFNTKIFDINNYFNFNQINKLIIEKHVLDISNKTKITNLLFRYPSSLSYGEKQRLKLAVSLIKKPKLLLLDEAITNIDPLLSSQIKEELKMLFLDLNIPIIYVSHDLDEIKSLCDKILVLDKGKLIQIGKHEDLFNSPINEFVSKFYYGQTNNLLLLNKDVLSKYCSNFIDINHFLKDENNLILIKNTGFKIVKSDGFKLNVKNINYEEKLLLCTSPYSYNNEEIKIIFDELPNIKNNEIEVKFICSKVFSK